MMNRCVYQQSVCEEMSASALNALVCPKPRRIVTLNSSTNGQIKPPRYQTSHQLKAAEVEGGNELFDFILPKGNFGSGVASSPPYFYGSPPSRTSNPITQDTRFVNNMYSSSPLSSPAQTMLATSPSSCGRMKFVHKPAAKRVEGFDCLSRDLDNCSISAVA
ncbi:uncharacterized protein LOC124936309 [Impatiens glandulifera]|uniref:uncharacterized protein LOC124936309 n=1 Tax=Impatiens glandulifera TaxID=253017 RepID=UPI001FB0E201|nr:uncharacterized protein LOC124936309 [Impatiens glandulifera]